MHARVNSTCTRVVCNCKGCGQGDVSIDDVRMFAEEKTCSARKGFWGPF